MAARLNPGDPFPPFTISTVHHGTLTIPDDLATPYTALLFYRAHW